MQKSARIAEISTKVTWAPFHVHPVAFDNHFETKVLFLMYFGSQIINEYYDDTNNGRLIKKLN